MNNNDAVGFLFSLAVILFTTKTLGLFMRKIGLPQVLGFILAGIIIGPGIWSFVFPGVNLESYMLPLFGTDRLKTFAEIGVIQVMFMAGLETDLSELKRTGFVSFMIALGGVLLPFGLGMLAGRIFLPETGIRTWMFLGTILCATSVGITVETLREMDKLKGKVGTTILSAAIIDDILGIIMLSVIMNLELANSPQQNSTVILQTINPNNNIFISVLWMLAFFVLAGALGKPISNYFKKLEKNHPKTRRQLIYSLVICFLYAYVAEKVFGVAEITGAFMAGVILSTEKKTSNYVDRRVNTLTYMIFGPLFFASIGINMSFENLSAHMFIFAIGFVVFAILGKIIGCGVMARIFGFDTKDSLRIGSGMIARGEVALVVANKGIQANLIGEQYIFIVVILVLISSITAPILLKLLFKDRTNPTVPLLRS